MACVFAVRVQSPLSFTSIAVQGFGRAEKKSWYTGFHREYWRVRGTRFYRSVIVVGAKCKNHDKLINYTVRVSTRDILKLSS